MRNPVIGYRYGPDGKYEYRYIFEGAIDNIASFIWENRGSDTVITDSMDEMILRADTGMKIASADMNYLSEKLEELLANYAAGRQNAHILEFERDGPYMLQSNIRSQFSIGNGFPTDFTPETIKRFGQVYVCQAVIDTSGDTVSAWYGDAIENDGFQICISKSTGEYTEDYRSKSQNSVFQNIYNLLGDEEASILYLGDDIKEALYMHSEDTILFTTLKERDGLRKVLDYLGIEEEEKEDVLEIGDYYFGREAEAAYLQDENTIYV